MMPLYRKNFIYALKDECHLCIFFKPRIVVGRSGNFLAFCLNFFRRNGISFLFCIFPPKRPQSFPPNNETNFKSSLVTRKGLIFSKGNIDFQEKHKNKRSFTTRKKNTNKTPRNCLIVPARFVA